MIALTPSKAIFLADLDCPETGQLIIIFDYAVYLQLPGLGVFRLNPVRLVWRSCLVVIITVSALLLAVHLMPRSLWGLCYALLSGIR